MINIKKKTNIICVLGVFLGIFMNRFLTARYGNNGSIILASIALIIMVAPIMFLVINKKYKQALLTLFMVLPCIVIAIGIYIDNLYLMTSGVILLLVAIPIMVKIAPKIKDKNH